MKPSQFFYGIVFFIAVTVLLCLPGSTLPRAAWLAVIHADKWVHIVLFALLCVSFSFPLRKSGFSPARKKRMIVLIGVAAICYGAIMEFVQDKWIPNRSFELADIGADAAGAILGGLISIKKWS